MMNYEVSVCRRGAWSTTQAPFQASAFDALAYVMRGERMTYEMEDAGLRFYGGTDAAIRLAIDMARAMSMADDGREAIVHVTHDTHTDVWVYWDSAAEAALDAANDASIMRGEVCVFVGDRDNFQSLQEEGNKYHDEIELRRDIIDLFELFAEEVNNSSGGWMGWDNLPIVAARL